jgi:oligopeptide/dipeptide ABC transporter ATP-binding protein
MDVLQRINRDHGTAVILISHNLGLVSQNCDRIIVMYAGRIVEDIAVEDLASTARHPYTRALLKAVPTMSRPRGERLEYIRGQAPDPAAVPTGCPYHPRCPIAIDRCRSDGPPLVEMPADAQVACWLATEAPP